MGDPVVLSEQAITVPTTSRLIRIGFNTPDSFAPEVQAWCEACGIAEVRFEYGFLLNGSNAVTARDLVFRSVEEAMMFKLRWL